jgi:hypothetical protein
MALSRRPTTIGLDHLVERQPLAQVLLGREPHLGVHDPVGGEILDLLGRHPLDVRGGLHDRDGVVECIQVADQRSAALARRRFEPGRELPRVPCRQRGVADLVGQVDQRGRPQASVKMLMQQHLRRAADGGQVESNG